MSDVDQLLDLFIHPGWKMVMQEMQEACDVLEDNCWHACESERQLYETKGRIKQLRFLLNYEDVIKANLDDVAA